MKIGISTAALFPEKHTEEAARIIKSLGAEVAEVFFSTFYEYRPEFAKALAPEIAGLKVNSVHAVPLNFEGNLFNSTRRVRGDGFYWLDQLARSSQLLKCENYTFHGFMRAGNSADDMRFIGERIAEAHAFTAGYGVNLCLENTAYYAFNRPSFFKEVRAYCPDLYGVFDLKQARRSGYPYQMYIAEMAGAIAYVHISDIDENGKTCLPGKGVYDYAEIFKRLKGAGFDGNVIIEPYRGDYGDVSELKESVDFLKEIADKV
ncbi:MAG: sugar phosphate isomerase/epimerase [Clostridiales bacterium]|nr:sugar phosphate isomerase/epimerase [Clostridiales bacterium]